MDAAWLSSLVLAASVLGLEVLAADPAGDRPGRVLLDPDPERPGWLAAAGHLEPLASLAGGGLAVAVLTGRSALLPPALATEQAQAAEGVAVQPDGRPQKGQARSVLAVPLVGVVAVDVDHLVVGVQHNADTGSIRLDQLDLIGSRGLCSSQSRLKPLASMGGRPAARVATQRRGQ